MSQRVRVSIWLLLSVSLTMPAAAQQKQPVGPFALDLRFAYGRHKAEPSVATDLGVEPGNLPPRTIGLVGGAHVYPLRSSKISLGVGANAVITRGSRALDFTETGSTTTVKSPTVRRHFTTISPEISLNFGHSHGWSYISGGMLGRSSLYLDRADAPGSNAPYRSTINYGGGARWFNTDHLAFSVDFRWYSVAEQAATASLVAQPRTTLLLLSAGVSFR
jgi:hypothetical protein